METENVIKAKHTKKRDPFSIIRWVILAVCVCVMGVSGYKLLDKYNTYRENKAIYDDIAKRALAPSSYNVPGNEQEGESTDPLPMRLANPIPEVDFAALPGDFQAHAASVAAVQLHPFGLLEIARGGL